MLIQSVTDFLSHEKPIQVYGSMERIARFVRRGVPQDADDPLHLVKS